jgi:hypothetical protein
MSATTIQCCPSCKKTFKARSRLVRHTARAPSCKWVHDGRTQDEVEMRDYQELSDREEDHLGNQDADESDGLGADEFAGVDESQPLLSPHATLPREASHNGCEDSVLIVEAYPGAGRVLGYDTTTHTACSQTSYDLETEGNPYHPFLNKGDYEVARWAVERGLGQNAFTDLLSIDGV